jgi:Ca-activated chloride channel family protein
VKLREAAAVLEERGPDITGMKPIEHLLRLDLHGFTPPDQPGWFYFSLQIHRASEEVLPVLPRDVFIAQDCSASMTSAKVQASRRGLQAMLRELPAADRFDIMSFRDRIERCFGEWTGVTPTARARAAWFVEQMDARGMTDVFAALGMLKGIPRDPDRPLIAVMISDGRPTVGLQDNMEIIHQFSRANAGAVSVFAFSGGSGVNRFLLDFLSYKNRGDSSIVRDIAGVQKGIESLFREVSRPVLMELEYRFSGLESAEIYPGMLTHLFLDRPLVLHGRVPAGTPATAVRITGRSGPATHDMVFPVEFASATPGDAGLRDGWTRQKLTWLIGQFIETRDPAFRDEAAALARSLGPTMPYAAELGVPDAPVRR